MTITEAQTFAKHARRAFRKLLKAGFDAERAIRTVAQAGDIPIDLVTLAVLPAVPRAAP